MVLMISYDLKGEDRADAYEAVAKCIKDNADGWSHPLKSQWFVETDMDPEWWTDLLMEHMEDSDSLFVCRIYSESYQGNLREKTWTWLNNRVDDVVA